MMAWLARGSLALAVLLGGCGDDDGGESATTGAAQGGVGGDASAGAGGVAASGGGPAGGAGGAAGGTGGTGGMVTVLPCSAAACDVTLSGTGFAVHDGKTLYWGLVEQGQAGLVYETSEVIAGGAFSSTGVAVVEKGKSYFLNYFVDKNGNQACDITPEDDVWRISLSNVQGSIELDVSFASGMSNLGCGGFP
jgi:hypothetical protein